MTVSELLSRISLEELVEWMAFARMQMLPEKAGDWRAAMLAATIANANRAPDSEPFSIDQFLPHMPDESEEEPDNPDASMKLLAYFEELAKRNQESGSTT